MILAWKLPADSGNDSRYVILAKLDSTRNTVVIIASTDATYAQTNNGA